MSTETLTSNTLIHPGEMIKDEIECRGISQRQLAKDIEMPYSTLNDILNGKKSVNAQFAMMLEAALGIDAGIWLRLQVDYDMAKAKQNTSFANRLRRITRAAAIF